MVSAIPDQTDSVEVTTIITCTHVSNHVQVNTKCVGEDCNETTNLKGIRVFSGGKSYLLCYCSDVQHYNYANLTATNIVKLHNHLIQSPNDIHHWSLSVQQHLIHNDSNTTILLT